MKYRLHLKIKNNKSKNKKKQIIKWLVKIKIKIVKRNQVIKIFHFPLRC